MAKRSGLSDNFYLAGIDMSGDVGAVTAIKMPRTLLDCTGINKSAHERFNGLKDGEISFNSFWNDGATAYGAAPANRAGAAGTSMFQLSSLPTADIIVSYFMGTALGGWTANMVAKQVNYDNTRGADGSLISATQCMANGFGLEWGQSLTAGIRTDTAATTPGTGVDNTEAIVSTAFGMSAYLQVFSFTGTSVTMQIQDSADNAAFANITGLAAFTVVNGVTSQRIETDTLARTIRRYLRVITTGTFNPCSFAVMACIYAAANREGPR